MKHKVIFTAVLFLTMSAICGCSEEKTDGKTAGEAKESFFSRVKQYTGWEKSEEEKQQEIDNIKSADELVEKWTAKLESQIDENDAYIRHESVTEADPWGTFVKVEYSKVGSEETMRVSSAGPDVTFGTEDDISRTRKTTNKADYLYAVFISIAIAVAWMITGFFVILYRNSDRRERVRRNKQQHDLDFFGMTAYLLFAPFILVVIALSELAFAIDAIDLGS